MKHLSIRWRLTLWYAAALGVILTGVFLILLVLSRQQLLARTDAALREELQELGLEVRLAKTAQELEEHLQARFFQHDIYDFLVSDEHATVLFASSGLTTAHTTSLIPKDLTDSWQFATQGLIKENFYRVARTAVDGDSMGVAGFDGRGGHPRLGGVLRRRSQAARHRMDRPGAFRLAQ